jgi:tRNA pseudouridine38-40 synthase
MRNIKLIVSYDGTDFHGWQIQAGQATIQGTLVAVASQLTQERVFLYGAGRTDAGVHALGQVAHFKTRSGLSPLEFQRAFNALLPPAIRVQRCEEESPDFHARFQAQAKTYQYRIFRGRIVPPFEHRYVLHYPFPLEEEAMARAARLFEGEHDFTSFAGSTGSEEDDQQRQPAREVMRSEIERVCRQDLIPPGAPADEPAPYELRYIVRGRSFLRYMVRKIVGTLLEVGRGKLQPEDIPQLFDLRDRSKSGPTVAPQGLSLLSVEYPERWRLTAREEK